MLCLPSGTGVRAALDRSCARRGIDVEVAIEAGAPAALLGFTARGLGVSVLTEAIAAGSGLTATPIDDADVTAGLGLVTRTGDQPPAVRLLHHTLAEHLRTLAPSPVDTTGADRQR